MIQGTTPTHVFTIPFSTTLIDAIKITYAQGRDLVLEKHSNDCTMRGNTITLKLTQEETLAFCNEKVVDIQVRVLTTSGEALVSTIHRVPVSKCLDREVLT